MVKNNYIHEVNGNVSSIRSIEEIVCDCLRVSAANKKSANLTDKILGD